MSNLLNKLIGSKRDMPATLTQWVRQHEEDNVSDEASNDDFVSESSSSTKRNAPTTPTTLTQWVRQHEETKRDAPTTPATLTQWVKQHEENEGNDDNDSEDDDIEIVKVEKGKRKSTYRTDDEIRVVKVTPPKKKRYYDKKISVKKEMMKQEYKGKMKEEKKEEEKEEDTDMVNYYVIHTCKCMDGSNVLTKIPGGYTTFWKCPVYIKMMHGKLYHVVGVWCTKIRSFIEKLDGDWEEGSAFDTDWEKMQSDHILRMVEMVEAIVKEQVMMANTVVLHSSNCDGIMHALPGCNKMVAKLVYYFCRSVTFHIRFIPINGREACTYDIGTLFSAGHEWHFGQWNGNE